LNLQEGTASSRKRKIAGKRANLLRPWGNVRKEAGGKQRAGGDQGGVDTKHSKQGEKEGGLKLNGRNTRKIRGASLGVVKQGHSRNKGLARNPPFQTDKGTVKRGKKGTKKKMA